MKKGVLYVYVWEWSESLQDTGFWWNYIGNHSFKHLPGDIVTVGGGCYVLGCWCMWVWENQVHKVKPLRYVILK